MSSKLKHTFYTHKMKINPVRSTEAVEVRVCEEVNLISHITLSIYCSTSAIAKPGHHIQNHNSSLFSSNKYHLGMYNVMRLVNISQWGESIDERSTLYLGTEQFHVSFNTIGVL